MQLKAVKQNGWSIRFIEKPTLEMQLEAVKQNGWVIRFIENPAPEVLTYLQQNPLILI